MDDHFWPAIYPGLIIGCLYGLSVGGIFNTAAGTTGGLIGALAAYVLLPRLGIETGFLSLAGLLALSFVGAFALVGALRFVTRRE